MEEIATRNNVSRQRVSAILHKHRQRKRSRVDKAYLRIWSSQFKDIGLARRRAQQQLKEQVKAKINQHYKDLKMTHNTTAPRFSRKVKQAIYDFRYDDRNLTLNGLASLAIALNSRVVIDFEVLTPEEIEAIGTPDDDDGHGAPPKPNPGHS